MKEHEKRIRDFLSERSNMRGLCPEQITGANDNHLNVSDLRALLADLDGMRVDAARYQWLRDTSQICGSMTGRGVALPSYETNNEQRTYLDECIDAALKGAEA